ncbi:hypothetical protein [Chromobacterium amazonense]|uniref:DUF4376 domain-containing protein n=1 Tax=Chromobacterium amazonense TaxID=1382803 RepID=A0ABU8V4A5_9NEIS|nr:hypothetical protein [Chromobacterium amazonense]MDQ4540539.1 hypothetical protein [Chromobacterium amazonense]
MNSVNSMYNGIQYINYDFLELPLIAAIQTACEMIDKAANQARARYIDDPLKLAEYQLAEKEALEYRAVNYQGDVPPTVLCWASATGLDGESAANEILERAAQCDAALQTIRSIRHSCKAVIRQATNHQAALEALDAAVAELLSQFPSK